MLRIRTAVSGAVRRICRVATAPFMLGSAKSITTTRGCSSAAASTASCPSLGLAHHANLRIVLQHAPESAPHQAVIVHQQHRNVRFRHELSCGDSRAPSAAPARRSRPRPSNSRRPFTSSARSRMETSPIPSASDCVEAHAVILHFQHHRFRQVAQAHRRPLAISNAGPRCSAPPAARGRDGSPRRGPVRGPRRSSRIVLAMPVCFSKAGQVLVQRALRSRSRPGPPGAAPARATRTFSSVDCTISCTSRRSARTESGSCAGRRPVRCSMAPMAVRIWPNSSCSSREMERNVFSCMEINCCASSLRRSESAATCSNRRRLYCTR